MFSKETYKNRRTRLRQQVGSGIILILGNNEVGMNYKGNGYHFRQDSNFLYFFGISQPGIAGLIDIEEGREIIFGDELTMEDIVWMGKKPTLSDRAAKVGIENTFPFKELLDYMKKAAIAKRPVHFTPPYRHDNMILLNQLTGIKIGKLQGKASTDLIKAIVAQRSIKSEEEVAEMENAVNITRAMHVAVMKAAAPGKRESELAGIAQGIATGMGNGTSYPIILTKNGQVLHNHDHSNILKTGQLILGDFGAENRNFYAGDITRTVPVAKTFSERQRDIYKLVLKAETECIAMLKPGLAYQAVHMEASRIIAEGLKEMGLMKGDTDEAVEQGAHALFFPHGLGHMIGLDVHDMEDLGEDFVGYSDEVKRSKLFGTAYLRLGRHLEPGFVLTVEPGIYFIPQLMDQWQAEGKFTDFIDYDELDNWRSFGGVRIEDNVLITEDSHRILGKPIPKTVEEVEALRG
ncbi:MAG TPA: aminopeptidase P family protein [Bacteroidetes bacterium]|nr:aminopeptidase P family protein [Bacteroidota bacterium]